MHDQVVVCCFAALSFPITDDQLVSSPKNLHKRYLIAAFMCFWEFNYSYPAADLRLFSLYNVK
ncbi:hypothetical protein Leryth_027445 [Lithospermum erythrorhizon]|nr:hypothetical protein Leryth_027445 [Lithospermum erythrorhizon]